MARVIERNIEALLARRKVEEKNLGWQERVAAAVGTMCGVTVTAVHVSVEELH